MILLVHCHRKALRKGAKIIPCWGDTCWKDFVIVPLMKQLLSNDVWLEFQRKLGPQCLLNLFDINKLRYECINNHQHNISTCYTTTILQTDTPACLGQWCSQETQATSKEDLEDFVQWRRRQPGNAKAMVSAECEAQMSRFIISDGVLQPDKFRISWMDLSERSFFMEPVLKRGGQMYANVG